jgi:hypothetical protein
VISSPALAANPDTSVPLQKRATSAADTLRSALREVQGDANLSLDFDPGTGFCSRLQASFKVTPPRGKEPRSAWFSFDPLATRFDAATTTVGKVRVTLLPLPSAPRTLTLRFEASATEQPVDQVVLGEFLERQGILIRNTSANLSALCNETADNLKDIRSRFLASGYASTTIQGKAGDAAGQCSLKVAVGSNLRTLPLGGGCADPRILQRIPQPAMAQALNVPQGQALPHLSCQPATGATLPARADEIPLKGMSPADRSALRSALAFYASNQTSCASKLPGARSWVRSAV